MQFKNIKHAAGFTLIELMIVIAILGILTAVAVPQYKQYVIRSNRAAAQAFMMSVASRETQYLLDARSYTSDLGVLGLTLPPEVAKNYDVTICVDSTGVDCTAPSSPPYFEITAAAISGKAQAADGDLTLDDTGAKTPPGKW